MNPSMLYISTSKQVLHTWFAGKNLVVAFFAKLSSFLPFLGQKKQKKQKWGKKMKNQEKTQKLLFPNTGWKLNTSLAPKKTGVIF